MRESNFQHRVDENLNQIFICDFNDNEPVMVY